MLVTIESIIRIVTAVLTITQKDSTKFHPKDVERLRTNKWWTERYLLVSKSDDEAFKSLVKCLEWRKFNGINEFNDNYFRDVQQPSRLLFNWNKQAYFLILIEIVFVEFADTSGRPVFWATLSLYTKSYLTPKIKQLVVYLFEKADRGTKNEGWAIVLDASSVGYLNLDMDFLNFILEVLTMYYPRGPKYILLLELPYLYYPAANLVFNFLGEDIKSRVKYINKDELTQYIDAKNIPDNLKAQSGGDTVLGFLPNILGWY